MLIRKDGILDSVFTYFERRRLRRSLSSSFYAGVGRDLYRYYQDGRSVNIYAELMLKPNGVQIYRQVLKWNDNGDVLSAAKQNEVLSGFCDYLDQKKVRWEFYGWEVNPRAKP
jgi:hypothetical protein